MPAPSEFKADFEIGGRKFSYYIANDGRMGVYHYYVDGQSVDHRVFKATIVATVRDMDPAGVICRAFSDLYFGSLDLRLAVPKADTNDH